MFRVGDYPQTATYWSPGVPNGFGGYTYARSTIVCRWEDKVMQFTDHKGEIVVSNAVVFVMDDVEMNGYLFLGTSTDADPTALNNAYMIKQFHKVPDLRNVQVERRAYL